MAEIPDLPFSTFARRVWEFANWLAESSGSPQSLSPIHMILAFDQAGRTETSSSASIISTVMTKLPQDIYKQIYQRFSGISPEEARKLWKGFKTYKTKSPEISRAAQSILEETMRVFKTVNQDGEVHGRYLMTALLLSTPPHDQDRKLLEGNGLNWDQLVKEMERYSASTRDDEDDRKAWKQVLLEKVPSSDTDLGHDETPADESSDEEQRDQPVPIEALHTYPLFGSMDDVISGAKKLATGIREPLLLSTSFMLYALVDYGQENPTAGTANWLVQHLKRASGYQSEREAYLRRKGTKSSVTVKQAAKLTDHPPAQITAYLERTLSRAMEIARRTGDREIHIRHMVASLLEELLGQARSGAQERLLRSGIDLPAIRLAYFAFVLRIPGGQYPIWEEVLLGPGKAVDRPADYISDAARGQDLIGIQREVNSFARLIAACSIAPPLSIGLFGDWGSGKTFFMNQLQQQVEELSKKARASGKRQREYPYYKRIAQIEFNAWHYVEGNLWDSLVEHIFANLRVSGEESVSDKLRKHLIKKLGLEERKRQQASAQVRQAQAEVNQANLNLKGARSELENKRQKLAEAFRQRDLEDFTFPDLEKDVKQLLQTLGLDELYEALRDMKGSLKEAHQVVARGNAILTPLIQAPDRAKRWQALIVSMILVPLLFFIIGLAPAVFGAQWVAQVTSLASGTAALIGFGANWLRNQTTWVSDRLKEVEQVQHRYDQHLAKALSKNTRRIKGLEQELAVLNTELEAALRRRDEAERRVAEAKTRLKEATVTNLLANFIQDRAESNDYRKHLGLVALIRADFEKLSNLMEEENWRLAPPAPSDRDSRFTSKKYETLEEEDQEKEKRINRIILYIDDLDRCPPNKVVEVLQAVHLLLAFPLFVVVVGVDARWITSSLEARYQELLHRAEAYQARKTSQSIEQEKPIFGKASPGDYLEKIFQVPFWLRPLNSSATLRMLDGLLALQPVETDTDQSQTEHGVTEPLVENTGKEDKLAPPSESTSVKEQSDTDGSSAHAIKNTDPEDSRQTENVVDIPDLHTETSQEAIEILKVTDPELVFMKELAPLLGRSPRALKRFVNVYRLLKARLTSNELQVFLSKRRETVSDYEVVLFLLAVDVGATDIAPIFFEKVLDGARQTVPSGQQEEVVSDPPLNNRPPEPRIPWLITQMEKDNSIRDNPDWQHLRQWLEEAHPSPNGPVPRSLMSVAVKTLAAWTPLVERYSFRVYNNDW